MLVYKSGNNNSLSDQHKINNVRGYFDSIIMNNESLVVSGWVFDPDINIDEVRVSTAASVPTSGKIEYREDIARHIPWCEHAGYSGFSVRINGELSNRGIINLFAYHKKSIVGKMRSWYSINPDHIDIVPPLELIERVAGMRNVAGFKMEGYKIYGEFNEAIERHFIAESGSLLDWGCGCGRTMINWPRDGKFKIYGCDVDSDAIEWCNNNIHNCEAMVIPLLPPTEYGANIFDIVISCSVLTHLDRDVQRAWLAEIHRVLKPGGIFIASVHGSSSALYAFPPDRLKKQSLLSKMIGHSSRARSKIDLDQIGILDNLLDNALVGMVPDGYYRSTFQSMSYTVDSWRPWFDILEYTIRGIGNNQDLVVGKKHSL